MRSFIIETVGQRAKLLAFLGGRDLPFQIEYGPVREQRTLGQNNRLWALHALASQVTGYSPEEMHEEALCRHFGFTEEKMPTGWIKRKPLKRSSTREKAEFAAFMEDTEAWYVSEFGVWLGQEETA